MYDSSNCSLCHSLAHQVDGKLDQWKARTPCDCCLHTLFYSVFAAPIAPHSTCQSHKALVRFPGDGMDTREWTCTQMHSWSLSHDGVIAHQHSQPSSDPVTARVFDPKDILEQEPPCTWPRIDWGESRVNTEQEWCHTALEAVHQSAAPHQR